MTSLVQLHGNYSYGQIWNQRLINTFDNNFLRYLFLCSRNNSTCMDVQSKFLPNFSVNECKKIGIWSAYSRKWRAIWTNSHEKVNKYQNGSLEKFVQSVEVVFILESSFLFFKKRSTDLVNMSFFFHTQSYLQCKCFELRNFDVVIGLC